MVLKFRENGSTEHRKENEYFQVGGEQVREIKLCCQLQDYIKIVKFWEKGRLGFEGIIKSLWLVGMLVCTTIRKERI